MTRLSEKRLVELACSDMEQRPDLWEHESMAAEILELRAKLLDSPPAMTWQAEPSGDGHAYVEGAGDSPTQVCYFDPVPGVNHGWEYCTNYGDWRPLNGRRVCPIPAPPELPKRGDA